MIVLQYEKGNFLVRGADHAREILKSEGYKDIKIYPENGIVCMDNDITRLMGRLIKVKDLTNK